MESKNRLLTPQQESLVEKMKLSSRIIKALDGHKKYSQASPFRHTSSKLFKIKEGKECVVCKEKRAIEFCHIIPVYFLRQLEKEMADLARGEDNGVILCKTHHWCFDHKQLTDEELEKIYQECKQFINTTLKRYINSKYSINPDSKTTKSDAVAVQKFVDWMHWVARVFFVKNN